MLDCIRVSLLVKYSIAHQDGWGGMDTICLKIMVSIISGIISIYKQQHYCSYEHSITLISASSSGRKQAFTVVQKKSLILKII